jgi:transposase, IS30 family
MPTHYSHLTLADRIHIQGRLEAGWRPAAIAAGLHRSRSTISRELRRNAGCKRLAPPQGVKAAGATGRSGYAADRAQLRAEAKAVLPRTQRRLVPGSQLWEMVADNLRAGFSPEQIAGTLKRMGPELAPVRLSHEAIYQAIYILPRGALRTEVISLLRQGHRKRRPRARGRDRRGQIPNLVSIHQRPPEAADRLVPGHWEGDTLKGRFNRSAVGTLVERSSLFVLVAKMKAATAEAAVDAFAAVLNRVDAQRKISLTYDRGREMAQHESLTQRTGISVYFADPHAPWQRGLNENTNGLLRQYLPKGEDLSCLSQLQLDQVAWLLNTRPRKSLGWKCPAELFFPDFDFVKYYAPFVALRT